MEGRRFPNHTVTSDTLIHPAIRSNIHVSAPTIAQKMKSRSLSALVAATLFAAASASAAGRAPDLDGDGVPNIVDPDIDNDGVPNALDRNIDGGIARSGPHAGKHIGDHLDNDSPAERDIDDDGQDDGSLADRDIDGDGRADDSPLENDTDGDRRNDDSAAERDVDGDGQNDDEAAEDDIDGDGFADDDDTEMDIDGDNTSDDNDADVDGDGRNNDDNAEMDTDGDNRADDDAAEDNDDGDSLPDRADADDDNDGVEDNNDPDHRGEADELEVQVSLARQAAPSGSRSRVKIQRMATGKVELELDARGLTAGAVDVTVDGVVIGQMVIDAGGEGEQQWETNANDQDEINLTIDVIGKSITVGRAGVVYFAGTVPQPPDAPTGVGVVVTPGSDRLIPGPAAPVGAKGKLEAEFGGAGVVSLELEVEALEAGSYTVVIGGEERAVMTVSGGKGKVRWDTEAKISEGRLPLDFAAAGLPVSIVQGEAVYFTGNVPAAGPGVADGEDGGGGETPAGAVVLTRTAEAPAAAVVTAAADFGVAGIVSIEVEAEALEDGEYAVLIDGVVRGVLVSAGGEAKLRWDTEPDAARGDLMLDFASAGAVVKIRNGDTDLFTGLLPASL